MKKKPKQIPTGNINYTLTIDPHRRHYKQVGVELIPKTNADIIRSFTDDCDNAYGFDDSDGPIVAIWRVKWKVYPDYHTLKICE